MAFLPCGVLFGSRQWDLQCGCAPDAPAELTGKGLPVRGAVLTCAQQPRRTEMSNLSIAPGFPPTVP